MDFTVVYVIQRDAFTFCYEDAEMRVPNRFGGMRDLAFFRRDIWDLS